MDGWTDGEVWKTGKTRQIRYGISVSRGVAGSSLQGSRIPRFRFHRGRFGFPFLSRSLFFCCCRDGGGGSLDRCPRLAMACLTVLCRWFALVSAVFPPHIMSIQGNVGIPSVMCLAHPFLVLVMVPAPPIQMPRDHSRSRSGSNTAARAAGGVSFLAIFTSSLLSRC